MANRTFYAVQAIGVAPDGSSTFTRCKGVQSIGISTTFNLEDVFELGQIETYEIIEGVPDIEFTAEKVLDGDCPLYLRLTQGASSTSLSGRSAKKAAVALSIYDDTQDSASGTPISQVTMSGLAVSSVTYNFSVDGNFSEQVTAVGNDKIWLQADFTFLPTFPNTDEPTSIAGSGGVNRREDMLFTTTVSALDANNHVADPNCTILPGGTDGIPGISASGTNNRTNGVHGAHIQSINVSTNLGREQIFELGRKTDYFRFVTFPIQVTCDISTISTQGDLVNAGENTSLTNKTIRIAAREGLRLNLGTKNKLQSVNYAGGDTGGGNVTLSFSYRNNNSLAVSHPFDVTTALRP